MSMTVKLRGKHGNLKEVKVGFSWSVFFFGFVDPLFNGDFKWGIILLLLEVLISLKTKGMGAIIVSAAFSIFYNKIYINDLLKKGYEPASEVDAEILKQKL